MVKPHKTSICKLQKDLFVFVFADLIDTLDRTSSFIHEMLNSFQTCGSGLTLVNVDKFGNGLHILPEGCALNQISLQLDNDQLPQTSQVDLRCKQPSHQRLENELLNLWKGKGQRYNCINYLQLCLGLTSSSFWPHHWGANRFTSLIAVWWVVKASILFMGKY